MIRPDSKFDCSFERAEELFLEVCDLPSAERDQRIAEASRDDEILGKQIRRLIEFDSQPDGLLDNPNFVTREGPILSVEEFQQELDDARYRIVRKLGEGGMGIVFLAEQTSPVKRLVAIKVVRYCVGANHILRRFESERQALAGFDHPNLNRLFDGGITSKGRPYFVMDFVDGIPINRHCVDNNVSLENKLQIFLDVCKTVQHAHEKGIIHRDIKPANILIVDSTDQKAQSPAWENNSEPTARVKVIDFGIAKALEQHSAVANSVVTQVGDIIGTPQYMSPEQIDSAGADVDVRSDIYSLGVLLYELLTGSTPVREADLFGLGWLQTLELIRDSEPEFPSQRVLKDSVANQETPATSALHRTVRQYARSLRHDLDWITFKALSRNRLERYESVAAFAADIRRFLDGEPVSAGRPSRFNKIARFASKYKWSCGIAGFLLMALCLTSYIGFDQAYKSRVALKKNSQLLTRLQQQKNQLEDVIGKFKLADQYRKDRIRIEKNEELIRAAILQFGKQQNQRAAGGSGFPFISIAYAPAPVVSPFLSLLPVEVSQAPLISTTLGLCESSPIFHVPGVLFGYALSACFSRNSTTQPPPELFEIENGPFDQPPNLSQQNAPWGPPLTDPWVQSMTGFDDSIHQNINNGFGRVMISSMLCSNCLTLSSERDDQFLPELDIETTSFAFAPPEVQNETLLFYEVLLKLQQQQLGFNDLFVCDTLECQSQTYYVMGQFEKALEGFQTAAECHRRNRNRFRLIYARIWQARTLLRLKRNLQALNLKTKINREIGSFEKSPMKLKLDQFSRAHLRTIRTHK